MITGQSKQPGRILVIDDTKADRDLFKHVLTRAGFHVEQASDGLEALDLLAEREFDLILCDYLMPNMDGHQFLIRLREDIRHSHIIAIIVTSDETEETKVALLKAGANDFIHKGVSFDEIIARIHVHLDAQKALAHRRVLELAGEMTDNICQPLSVLVAALDVLREKIRTEVPPEKNIVLLEMVSSINKQADKIMGVAENLKKLRMDTRKHYKIEGKKI